jgi:hypothetical protein
MPITFDTWTYIVGVVDRSDNTLHIYQDGSEVGVGTDISTIDSVSGIKPFLLSRAGSLDGMLDDVRVSKIIRSAGWVETEFNNQNDTASFLYAGSEETPPSSSTTESTANYEWVELYNKGNTPVDLTGWYLTDNDGLKFDISGAGSIPSGGYLVCHLGEGGTNSSTDVYGYIDYETEITIQPDANAGKDVHIDSSLGILNMGNSITMTITNASSLYIRPMVQFDLSSLPPGFIKDAKVWLYRSGGHSSTSATVNLHRVTQSWTEGDGTVNSGANWATYDGTNSWANSGGDYDSSNEDTKIVVAGTNAWYYWNATDLVDAWERGTYSNYGMIFEANDGSEYQYLASSDNSDSSYHPKLIVNMTTTTPMLGNSDDLSLVKDSSIVIDYVAWGADAGPDDDEATAWGQWTDGEYVDTSELIENQTIGRDKDSNDTNLPADWEDGAGKADPFGIDRSTENGSTPNAQNIDVIIPEFDEFLFPIIFMLLLVAVWREKMVKKRRKK